MDNLGALGLINLIDSNSIFFTAGLPVFYRTQNYDQEVAGEGVSEMGFSLVPAVSGTYGYTPGTTDTKITPQPAVRVLPQKMLADAQAAGSALRQGARSFNISHSWVDAIRQVKGFQNPRQVFNDPGVVGLFHDGLLFQIVSFVHNDAYGHIVDWDVVCNSNELQ